MSPTIAANRTLDRVFILEKYDVIEIQVDRTCLIDGNRRSAPTGTCRRGVAACRRSRPEREVALE